MKEEKEGRREKVRKECKEEERERGREGERERGRGRGREISTGLIHM